MWTNAINLQPVASTTNKQFWDHQVYHFHLRCKLSPPLMSDYHLHVIVDSVPVCCQLKEDICGQPVWTLVHVIMSTTSVCWRSPTRRWSHKHAVKTEGADPATSILLHFHLLLLLYSFASMCICTSITWMVRRSGWEGINFNYKTGVRNEYFMRSSFFSYLFPPQTDEPTTKRFPLTRRVSTHLLEDVRRPHLQTSCASIRK